MRNGSLRSTVTFHRRLAIALVTAAIRRDLFAIGLAPLLLVNLLLVLPAAARASGVLDSSPGPARDSTPRSAGISITLSRASGLPGQRVTLRVTNPTAVSSVLPLSVQLHPTRIWPLWPCNAGGSRYLGKLSRGRSGSGSLTFIVPNVARGVYYLVASTRSSPCLGPGDGPTPAQFEVLPRVAVHLPDPELVTPPGRIGPAFEGCATWNINGGQGGDDCGPYEYGPTPFPSTVVAPGAPLAFGISPDWHYDAWSLYGIPEREMASVSPPQGERFLASGKGGKRTISAAITTLIGRWRLFLSFHATRGTNTANIDRPTVFRVDFRLP